MRGRSWFHRALRSLPRRRHLRGTGLHKLLGERILHSELWRLTRESVAGGMAVGLFFGMTPTLGIQAIMAGLAAVFLRVNVPVALAATLVTNPLTAPVIFTLEYQLGAWLYGTPALAELEGYSGLLRGVLRGSRPLLGGSLIAAGISAVVGYGLVMLLWPTRRRARTTAKPPGSV